LSGSPSGWCVRSAEAEADALTAALDALEPLELEHDRHVNPRARQRALAPFR